MFFSENHNAKLLLHQRITWGEVLKTGQQRAPIDAECGMAGLRWHTLIG